MKNTFLINFIGHFLLLLRKVNFFTTNKKQHPFGTLRKFYKMPFLIDKYQIFAIFYDEIVVTWPSSLNELQIFVASSSQTNNELKTILCFFLCSTTENLSVLNEPRASKPCVQQIWCHAMQWMEIASEKPGRFYDVVKVMYSLKSSETNGWESNASH